ncbi:MAG: polyphosphate kinase 1 [Pedobacter sp.]|nr:MAG: polyphosphate kinase 1 [Pedobacter sp.]
MAEPLFVNRDLSWLSFNERVLLEASKESVPLLERIKFLSIYSSNLDEFYRVRIPVLMALAQYEVGESNDENIYELAKAEINRQQQLFGKIIHKGVLPGLADAGIHWVYGEAIPLEISKEIKDIFFNELLAYINVIAIEEDLTSFFAENNKLYQAIILTDSNKVEHIKLINIPSDTLPRLYSIKVDGLKYVVFLEDILKDGLAYLFPGQQVSGAFNLKITRDAQLEIDPKFEGDLTEALERQLERRDFGLATRFLYEPGIALRTVYNMIYEMNLQKSSIVEGGKYHNLKDLSSFPLKDDRFSYPPWPSISSVNIPSDSTLFEEIIKGDILINVPYQSYDPVLRFFNEAANDSKVMEVYTTLYRVANNSRIVSALITAAKNGKKVVVMVELKARFDEANNIKWAKQMRNAGVNIIYSNLDLKVHAKVALVKRTEGGEKVSLGLLATGNLNEITSRFYTDQVLLTANQALLGELSELFLFLATNKKAPSLGEKGIFRNLLVAQFNLQERFLALIEREIQNANAGLSSGITIKLNNLEEQKLIKKLYEASGAGVRIKLIVRGICCLNPGVAGLSEHITVKRIVDRYLEHSRIFQFDNNGNPEVFMGSADWMNRNIYGRIEVCFPIYDSKIKGVIMQILNLQLMDNEQHSIYEYLKKIN